MPDSVDQEEIRTVTISRWASTRVTAVISVGLFITLTLAYLLTGGGEDVFHRNSQLRTYFDDGTGLVRTADVMLDGIKVGEIRRVGLSNSTDPKRAIEVQMNIRNNFLTAIPDDSQTEITADNLVGDKYINIKRGQSMRSIVPGEELKRVPPTNNFDPADLLASISATLKRATDLLDQVENPSTPLGTLVKGEDLYTQVRDDIRAIQNGLEAYTSPKSDVGQAIYNQDLYNQIRKPVMDLDQQLAQIENGEGQYGALLKDSSQYDDAVASVRKLRDSVRQIATSPMMASDEQYQEALRTLTALNATFDETTRGEGLVAQLLSSTQLYEQLNGTSRETRAFVHDFRLNPRKYLRIKVF